MRVPPLILVAIMLGAAGAATALGDRHAPHDRPERVAHTTPGGSPLDEILTPPQRAAFARATSSLSLAMYADALPIAKARELVNRACRDLDRSVPLLDGLHDTCEPTLELVAAQSLIWKMRCTGASASCIILRRRQADAYAAAAASDRAYARIVRREVPRGDCRDQLAPIHDTVAAELKMARAGDDLADAFERGDDQAEAAAKRTMRKQFDLIVDDLVWYRTRDMAEACNVEPWTFETAA